MRELDKKILLQLIRDSKQPIYLIAERVGASRQTVAKMIEKLREQNLIKFTVRLNPQQFDLGIKAYILLRVDPKIELRKKCEEEIKKFYQVTRFHYIFGPRDALLEVLVRNNQELTRLVKRIHKLPGVRETETFVVHSTVKDEPNAPFIEILKTEGEHILT